jgi:adenylate cyclase
MSLLGELKRRNVLRVGAAYLAASWLIVQVVETLFPVFGLTDAGIRTVVVLLAIGFLPVLVLSWAFQLTPEGLKRDSAAGKLAAPRGSMRMLDRAIVIILVIGISYFAFDKFVLTPGRTVEREARVMEEARAEVLADYLSDRSIAVLPFLNLSDAAGQVHFVDGLTEELLNLLAATDGLRVVSRTSSFMFKNSDLPTTEIAAQLGVAYLLEGSVRRTGEAIRVTAQLVDTKLDAQVWSRTYEDIVGTENLFDVQENIAGLVADALQVRLLPENVPQAPNSMETLDLYYDGLATFREIQNGHGLSDERFIGTAAKFEAALEAEPGWLPALLTLGQLYHWWSLGVDAEKLEMSRSYISEVLRRDPQNVGAHASMGYILWARGDFKGSLESYEKASQTGGGHGWGRAITLKSMGRFDEAVAAFRASLPMYPVSESLRTQLTHAMYCGGQYDGIVSRASRLIAFWPADQVGVKAWIAASHARLGGREEALAYVDELAQKLGSEAYFAATLAAAGEYERARHAIDYLVEHNVDLASAASAALQLGDQDRALGILERLDEQYPPGRTDFLLCEPEIRALGGNARYDAILRNRGLLPD